MHKISKADVIQDVATKIFEESPKKFKNYLNQQINIPTEDLWNVVHQQSKITNLLKNYLQ